MQILQKYDSTGRFFYIADALSIQQRERLAEIAPWYEKRNVHAIIESLRERGASLRLIDWFVTKYAEKLRVCEWTSSKGVVDVATVYRRQLRIWRRRLFDPFARFERVMYVSPEDGVMHQTSVGQLNFFYIMTRAVSISKLLQDNDLLRKIRLEMIRSKKDKKKNTNKKKSKKRKADIIIRRKAKQR